MKFETIKESKQVIVFLEKRKLTSQYLKSKNNLLSGHEGKYFFKERKPSGSGIWYFRINKKYRALAYLENKTLKVYDIDSHQ